MRAIASSVGLLAIPREPLFTQVEPLQVCLQVEDGALDQQIGYRVARYARLLTQVDKFVKRPQVYPSLAGCQSRRVRGTRHGCQHQLHKELVFDWRDLITAIYPPAERVASCGG